MCNFAFCKYLHSYSRGSSTSTSNIGSGSNMKWNQIKFALEFRRFRAESSQSAVNRRHCHSTSSLSLIFYFPLSLFLSVSLCLSPPERTLHKTKSRDENLLYYYYDYWAFMRARWEHRKLQILRIQRNPFNHAPKALPHHPPCALPPLLLTLCYYAAQCWRQMDFYNSLRGCISKSNFRFSLKAFSLASSVPGIALSATLQSVHATWSRCQGQHLSN